MNEKTKIFAALIIGFIGGFFAKKYLIHSSHLDNEELNADGKIPLPNPKKNICKAVPKPIFGQSNTIHPTTGVKSFDMIQYNKSLQRYNDYMTCTKTSRNTVST